MTASEALLAHLAGTRVSTYGLSAETLARTTELKLSTVRSTLTSLQYAGQVKVCGSISGSIGRPANLYCRA